ncbi:hypothetical protein RvY_00969 [Ramazzottius varieornatus]|uniref:Folate receptor-like domain-containing protein n=1 Tax=Ramazzottius varieornatus TaxID=947166 RepID=A0A1D1UEM0_RAMVA|nr:hypothetical protein RvY_00969 [Ramazzottius varieornatus]
MDDRTNFAFFIFILEVSWSLAQDQLLNQCIEGRHHKENASPEPGLSDTHCSAWSKNSCCSIETALGITANSTQDGSWLNFRWDHCENKPLSEKCREHFVRDLCFYECSPNTGPWIVDDKRKIRSNRFMKVPLCQTDCDNWFKDCADDFTCTRNWARDFKWEGGVNKCPPASSCRTFIEVFGSAKNFCESVFDHSFVYAPDWEPCMRLWFDGSSGNPNDKVAAWKARRLRT